MPDKQRRAQRTARIACGRLNEETFERSLGHDASVHDGVERDAAGHAEVLAARLLIKTSEQVQRRVFQNFLRTRGDVPVFLRKFITLFAWLTQRLDYVFAELVVLGEMVIEHA